MRGACGDKRGGYEGGCQSANMCPQWAHGPSLPRLGPITQPRLGDSRNPLPGKCIFDSHRRHRRPQNPPDHGAWAPTVTTIQLGLQQAQRIASMLNALPTFAGGAPNAGGPPDTVLVVTFVTDGMTRTFTMGNEFGFIGVDVDLDGDAQQQLIDSGPLLTYLDSLFGVIDSPEPVVSPPTG
jgi:hypothetical protein